MGDTPLPIEGSTGTTDRRTHARKQIDSLAYVDLGEDNGGLVLNMGEGGMAVRSAIVLAAEHLPKIRFQMPQSLGWVEATGRIAWTGDSRRMAGIEFIDLPEDAGNRIRKWMNSEGAAAEALGEASTTEEPPAAIEETATPPLPTVTVEAVEAETATQAAESAPASEVAPPPRSSAMRMALASKSQPTPVTIEAEPSIAEEIAARRATEDAALIHAPGADPPPAWAASSILHLSAPAPASAEAAAKKTYRWLSFVAVAALLAAISFYLGISAGQVGMRRVLSNAKNLITGSSDSGGKPALQQADASISPSAGSPSKPTAGGNLGAASERVNTGASTTGISQGSSPASEKPAQSFTVHRTPEAGGTKKEVAVADEDSTSVLNLPDAPVMASNSVAVSSQLYIPLPAVTDSQHGGDLQIGRLERRTEIAYPPDAAQLHIEGIVKLHIFIGQDGGVHDVSVLNGDSTLAAAAVNAVQQWQYKPTLLDGKAIETQADLTITFRLPQVTQ